MAKGVREMEEGVRERWRELERWRREREVEGVREMEEGVRDGGGSERWRELERWRR